ncbi:MAG TPA: hypothetical protein QF753_22615 [Victivallales bacterium]|nr:hypothetical protein [Victivallales bacterium]
MKNKKKLFLIFTVIICIFLLPTIQKQINKIKVEDKLIDTNIIKNAPPAVAFTTVALGGFRGLIADVLWFRTISLQNQGKYIEMAQIASWISKLQPRFTGATAFLAWNMAYNISITYTKPENKWRWVENGIKLLKDSIKYNPGSPVLYKELAWIYIYKIGGTLDSANLYYKTQVALQIEKISNGKNLDINSLYKISQNIKHAPNIISGIQTKMKKLNSSNYNSLNNFFNYYRKYHKVPKEISKVLTQKEIKTAVGYFKIQMLKNDFMMDIKSMHKVYEDFGNIDWRLYQTHALYWIIKALKLEPKNNEYKSIINIIFKSCISDGKLLLLDKSNYKNFTTYPNLKLISPIKNYLYNQYNEDETSDNKKIYLNYLETCITLLYKHENLNKAKNYLLTATKLNQYKNKYITIQQYMNYYWESYLSPLNKTETLKLVDRQIFLGYLLYALGEKKASNIQFKLANFIYMYYKNKHQTVILPEFKNELKKMLIRTKEKLPDELAEKLTNN